MIIFSSCFQSRSCVKSPLEEPPFDNQEHFNVCVWLITAPLTHNLASSPVARKSQVFAWIAVSVGRRCCSTLRFCSFSLRRRASRQLPKNSGKSEHLMNLPTNSNPAGLIIRMLQRTPSFTSAKVSIRKGLDRLPTWFSERKRRISPAPLHREVHAHGLSAWCLLIKGGIAGIHGPRASFPDRDERACWSILFASQAQL